jgi:hypothetical protein
MKHGFITKKAATKANVTVTIGLKHVCPKQGAVLTARQAIYLNLKHNNHSS